MYAAQHVYTASLLMSIIVKSMSAVSKVKFSVLCWTEKSLVPNLGYCLHPLHVQVPPISNFSV